MYDIDDRSEHCVGCYRTFVIQAIVLVLAIIVGVLSSYIQSDASEATYTIPAGTYRFNDVLSVPSADLEQAVAFTTNATINGDIVSVSCSQVILGAVGGADFSIQYYVDTTTPVLSDEIWGALGVTPPTEIVVYKDVWLVSSFGEGIQTITIPKDTEVSDEFYNWFIANTVRQYDPSELTIQGSYIFKNDLTSYLNTPFRIPLNFTVNTSSNTYQYTAIGSNGNGEMFFETESGDVEVVYDELYGGWPIQDYRSFVLNSPTVLTYEQYSIFQNLVVPLERVTPIRGKWVFNDILSPPSQSGINGAPVNLRFTAYILYASANVVCYADQISLNYTNDNVDMFYRVVSSVPDLHGYGYNLPFSMQVVDDNQFVSVYGGGTKYIDFGDQEQYMPTRFYNWFISNAKPYSNIDKDAIGDINDALGDVEHQNPEDVEDALNPDVFVDLSDPAFLGFGNLFKSILDHDLMFPIIGLTVVIGGLGVILFGKRG